MNRTIIASLILVLSISLGIIILIYVESACADMIDTTDTAISAILTDDKDKLTESIDISIEKLEKNRPFLNVIIGQDETIELRGILNQAIFYFNCNDYEMTILHLREYKTRLNRIILSNEPTPSTIF